MMEEGIYDLFQGNTIRIYGLSPRQILELKRFYISRTGDLDLRYLNEL